jgi:hypothetical protein
LLVRSFQKLVWVSGSSSEKAGIGHEPNMRDRMLRLLLQLLQVLPLEAPSLASPHLSHSTECKHLQAVECSGKVCRMLHPSCGSYRSLTIKRESVSGKRLLSHLIPERLHL